MHLLLTGATGSIGRRLVLSRLAHGDRLTIVSRDAGRAGRLFAADANSNIKVVEGDCTAPGPWQRELDGVDAVVHLAGAGIADRRWSAAYRQTIVDSRLDGTHQVVMAMEEARARPRVFVAASATGYYGDTAGREADENAPPGEDFLARLCVRWESEARRAAELGVRSVQLRIGIVLDERGGALPQMVPFFRRFVGGPLGSGRQYVPWIHWRDVVGLVDLALRDERAKGPLNASAPNPVTSREFAQALGRALSRPALLPAPWLALRLAKGGLADHLVMSQRAIPAAALRLGYRFVHPEIGEALRAALAPAEGASAGVGFNGAANGAPTGANSGAPEGASNGASNGAFSAAPAGALAGASTGASTGASRPGSGAGPGAALAVATRGGAASAPGGAAGPGRPLPDLAARRTATPPAKVRLVAIDVDGTLLRSDGRLADPVAEALRRAERLGVVVVLATARSPRLNREVVAALRLQQPTINCNGAVIWNPLEDRVQFHESLAAETGAAVVALARRIDPDVVVEIDVLDRCWSDRVDPRLQVQVSRLVHPDHIGPLDAVLQAPTTRVNLIAPPERLARVVEAIQREFWTRRQVGLYLSHPCLVQVTAPLADKGIALQRVARRMKASREEVMAIGDGLNDLGMLEWAGFGVALGNASPQVKLVADALAPTNDENGVAWALERWAVR